MKTFSMFRGFKLEHLCHGPAKVGADAKPTCQDEIGIVSV